MVQVRLQSHDLGVPDDCVNIFKKRRLELGYSQRELADVVDLPQQVISRAEKLNVKNVKLGVAVKLAKTLEIDLRLFEILAEDQKCSFT